jgi:hypothetical protein
MTSHRRAYMVQWAYENPQPHISQPTTRVGPVNAMDIVIHSAYTWPSVSMDERLANETEAWK